jgi:hypothetical protein
LFRKRASFSPSPGDCPRRFSWVPSSPAYPERACPFLGGRLLKGGRVVNLKPNRIPCLAVSGWREKERERERERSIPSPLWR